MQIVDSTIDRRDLNRMAQQTFGNFIKAVVDVEKEIIALDADLHADMEGVLLSSGSLQGHLWGINLYPDRLGEDWVEFDSMINLRPSQGNRSRDVEDPTIQKKIIAIVQKRILQ